MNDIPGIQGTFSDSVTVSKPGEESLDTKTVSTVFAGTILTLVGEPVIRSRVDSFSLIPSGKLCQIGNPHRSTYPVTYLAPKPHLKHTIRLTDDLTDTRDEQIAALSENMLLIITFLSRHLLHIERLQLRRETIEENWYCENIGHFTLCGFGDIVTDDMVDHNRVALVVFDNVAIGILLLVLDTVLVQPFDCLYVGETEEWS